jgi:hypothetical protein
MVRPNVCLEFRWDKGCRVLEKVGNKKYEDYAAQLLGIFFKMSAFNPNKYTKSRTCFPRF